jgi:AraC-like DNA-binding protein
MPQLRNCGLLCRSLLDRGVISVRDAAEALNLSERTLHRRLALEGATYLKLLDQSSI